jgi:hypothetical protein
MSGRRLSALIGAPSRFAPRLPSRLAVSLIFLALAAALPGPVLGQDTTAKANDPAQQFKPHLVALPIIYYTPETRLALGAGGVLHYRLGRDKGKTRPSSIWFLGVYTMNSQIQVQLRPEIYLPLNAFILNAVLKYDRFPQKFFGIGSDVPASAAEGFTPETLGLSLSLKRKIVSSLFGGIEYQVERTLMQKIEPGGALATGTILGSQGGVISGLGMSLTWDSRDNVIFPRRGVYFLLVADFYNSALGSDYHYSASRFDLRTFIPVRETHVLALQFCIRNTGGNPPFYELSMLGGASIMRGYYSGQYRDMALLAFQAEYRLPLYKRLSMAGFFGLGDVAPSLRTIKLNRLKYSIGGGIRYKIDPREGTNVRLDFAWGRHSTGFYMTVQEAF